jgi:hypothetical protein
VNYFADRAGPPVPGNVNGLTNDFVQKIYEQSVKMLVDFEFDGVKRASACPCVVAAPLLHHVRSYASDPPHHK